MAETEQINLKLSKGLLEAAQRYAINFGYRNVQELVAESMREKIFEKNEYDEGFSDKEIELVDSLIEMSVKSGKLVSEEELKKALNA
ncbi:hypothetical protein J4416_02840 [Candidatus Pacearchaeota archaeon]|nr:hypothetical protein [Candidatus Pacearchaeota archaeon]